MSQIGDLFHYVFEQPIFNMLMAVYAIVHTFWLSIVIMTLLVRTAMIPLIFRQLKSSKVMQEIAPQIQQIQREYRGEPVVMQQKTSALYKQYGVNPYASCLPLLVQLPFIYGLYGAFNSILRDKTATAHSLNAQLYPFIKPLYGPNGLIHFPNTQFLGISLAQPDPTHILPVLAAILTFMQLRMSLKRSQNQNQPKVAGAADPNAMTMKLMQYIMPLFTLFIGLSFPSGLALYWIVTTGYSVVQQYFFNGRNWGGLFDGIPGLNRQPQPALANGIVDSTTARAPYRNRFARVTEEPAPAVATNGTRVGRAPRGLPAPSSQGANGSAKPSANGVNGSRTNGSKANGNGTKPVVASVNGNGASGEKSVAATNAAKTVTRPNTPRPVTAKPPTGTTRTPTTPTRAGGKKDAVRLVTPQAGGTITKATGTGKTGAVPVTRVPKPAVAAARGVTSGKPKASTATQARKKGR